MALVRTEWAGVSRGWCVPEDVVAQDGGEDVAVGGVPEGPWVEHLRCNARAS